MRKIAANAVRQPANLSIDSQIMKEAKGLNVNVSRAAEAGIAEAVAAEKTPLWKLENRATMDAWNDCSKASEPTTALPHPDVFACQAFSASSNTFSPGMPFSMVSRARRPVL
ncbi:type II toxin-antitoxin system CcdA family antitoxin [Mesorhizobium abyssinicae]|uniref:type II toxin-antitoxin system CcdA family antitoxin n=1 Tax=Mesorhizobium abyssinicae TaxID=1209958 RepID=UPI00387DC82F